MYDNNTRVVVLDKKYNNKNKNINYNLHSTI